MVVVNITDVEAHEFSVLSLLAVPHEQLTVCISLATFASLSV